MIRIIILLLFSYSSFAQSNFGETQAYRLRSIKNNDSLYAKVIVNDEKDTLWRKVNGSYIFAYEIAARNHVPFSRITGRPTTLAGYGITDAGNDFSGSYNDLTNKPVLFDGNYESLAGKPNLFSGSYTDLTNKPSLFNGAYASLTGLPTIPTNTNQLTNGAGFITSITSGNVTTALGFTPYNATNPNSYITSAAITGKVNATDTANMLSTYLKINIAGATYSLLNHVHAYNTLTGLPTLFDGSYNSLTNKPTLFSGSYVDLTNKPTIPSNTNQLTNGAGFLVAADLSTYATIVNLNLKAPIASPTFTGTVSGITAAMVGLGNVANESKATMFTSPTFTGTVAGITSSMVGLGNVTNESKATMFASPTFTGTVTLPASTSFTTPVIGAATGTSLAVTGSITSSGGAIGYTTGNGGTVTQLTNRSTGVTINKLAGTIITTATSLAAAAEAAFTVTNSTVAIGDVIVLSIRSGQTALTSVAFVTAVANGSFQITISNLHATVADTGAMTINFAVIKSVNS